MKLQDSSRWRVQRAEAQEKQGDEGKLFCDFIEGWCSRAETVLAGQDDWGALECLRQALAPTEEQYGGAVPSDWLSQMQPPSDPWSTNPPQQ